MLDCFDSLTSLVSDAEQSDSLIVLACLLTSADVLAQASERFGNRLEVHSVFLNRDLLRHPVRKIMSDESVTQAFFSQTDFRFL